MEWLFPASNCKICGAAFKRTKYYVEINGKRAAICPTCHNRIERRVSNDAADEFIRTGQTATTRLKSKKAKAAEGGLGAGCGCLILIVIGAIALPLINQGSTPARSIAPGASRTITAEQPSQVTEPSAGGSPSNIPPTEQTTPVDDVSPLSTPPTEDTISTPVSPPATRNPIQVSALEAHALYQLGITDSKNQVVFIDTRTAYMYETSHVKGACPLNKSSFIRGDPPQIAWLQSLGEQTIYIVYGQEDRGESGEIASRLIEKGFPTPYIMQDGFSAWDDARYPIEHGKHPFQNQLKFR